MENQKNNTDQNLSNASPMLVKNKFGKVVCRHAWTSFDIYPNGNVTPCCYLPRKVMGNINKQSIAEIHNGLPFQKFRKEMTEKGAKAVCGNCYVLLGMNSWDKLDFYKKAKEDSLLRKNSELNEQEIFEGKEKLESGVRRLKYTPSYSCNLACYHCCQDQYRLKETRHLDEKVMEKVLAEIPRLEVIYPFGGEPFIHAETNLILREVLNKNPECHFFTTTNANCISDDQFKTLERLQIGKITVSIDAGRKESYERLRVKGKWDVLLKNIARLAELKKRNNFDLVFNATFNNKTYYELSDFLDLCQKYGAKGRPTIIHLKSNHGKDFWRQHIKMPREEVEKFKKIIDETLERELPLDTVNSLKYMQEQIRRMPFSEWEYFEQKGKMAAIKILSRTRKRLKAFYA